MEFRASIIYHVVVALVNIWKCSHHHHHHNHWWWQTGRHHYCWCWLFPLFPSITDGPFSILLDHGYCCRLLSCSVMTQCVMLDGCWQCVLWLTSGWYCCPSTSLHPLILPPYVHPPMPPILSPSASVWDAPSSLGRGHPLIISKHTHTQIPVQARWIAI